MIFYQQQQQQDSRRKQQHCMRFLMIIFLVSCLYCWIPVVKQRHYLCDKNNINEQPKHELKVSSHQQKKSQKIQQQQQHHHHEQQQQQQQEQNDYPTNETKAMIGAYQKKQQRTVQNEAINSGNSMDPMILPSSINQPITKRKLQGVERSPRKLLKVYDNIAASFTSTATKSNIWDRLKSYDISNGEKMNNEDVIIPNSMKDDTFSFFMYRLTYIETMIEQTTTTYLNRNDDTNILLHESELIGAIPILINGTEMDDIYKVTNISFDIFEQNHDLISLGMFYIMIQPPPKIIQSSLILGLDGELIIRPDSTITPTLPNQMRNKSKLEDTSDKISLPSIANKTLGIIRISANDSVPTYDAQTLYDGIFNEDRINVKTQYEKCSFGQLIWNPLDIGIIEVYVNESISNFQAGSQLINAALNQLNLYGTDTIPPTINFNTLADKIIIVVPPGTGSWIANSGMNFWRAQFNDKWSLSLSALMHELGHTIGLTHSNENGIRYDDRTSYMSGSYTSPTIPQKCFNGVQNYQLQWYKKRHRTLSIEQLLYKSFSVNVATFVDYDKTMSSETVILNIANVLFLQYNVAKDFNIGTEEKKNQTTITTNADGGSSLLGGLSVGDQFYVYLNIDMNYVNDVNHHQRERRMNDVAISLGNYSIDYLELSYLYTNNNNNDNNNNHTTAFDHFLRSVPRLKPDRDINSETSSDNDNTDNNGNNNSNTDNNGNNNNDTITTGTKSILLTIQACEVKYGELGAEIMVISISLKNEIICHQTEQPTPSPSYSPTMYPSSIPTVLPSLSSEPTFHPTRLPSNSPTTLPTSRPTLLPSHMPTRSSLPSISPTIHPSIVASDNPSKTPTSDPTQLPTISRTRVPSTYPSNIPSNLHSSNPSQIPTNVRSGVPSLAKSNGPSQVRQPSDYPTTILSQIPSKLPSSIPSILSSDFPSNTPTLVHSDTPSVSHSSTPTKAPSSNPTIRYSGLPTIIPTLVRSDTPTASYSNLPTLVLSDTPSALCSSIPTIVPSSVPSVLHSDFPTIIPTFVLSKAPSASRSNIPTNVPSSIPSVLSTAFPSIPTLVPSDTPSALHTDVPTNVLSSIPSILHSDIPTIIPTIVRSATPSVARSNMPAMIPNASPSTTPAMVISSRPSDAPATSPSAKLSQGPSMLPKNRTINIPSVTPAAHLSFTPSVAVSVLPSTMITVSPSLSSSNPSDVSISPSEKPTSKPSVFPVTSSRLSETPQNKVLGHPSFHPTYIELFDAFQSPADFSSSKNTPETSILPNKILIGNMILISSPPSFEKSDVDSDMEPTPKLPYLSSLTNSELKDLLSYITSSNHSKSQNDNQTKTIDHSKKTLPRVPYMFQIKKLFGKRNDGPNNQHDNNKNKKFKYRFPKLYTAQDNHGENNKGTTFLFKSLFTKNQNNTYHDMESDMNDQDQQNAINDERTDSKRSRHGKFPILNNFDEDTDSNP